MRISVIVPTYNDAHNLEGCLSSISSSIYRPYEVIVVDDASTDNTHEVVKRFGYKYVKLKQNKGQATARNNGAKIAKGSILFFVDSDVKIRKNTIKKVAEAYKDHKVMIYQGIASKKPINKGFGPQLMALKWYYVLYKMGKESSYVHSHVFSILRKVFLKSGGFNGKYRPPGCGEEFEFGQRLRKKYVLHTNTKLLVEHRFQTILKRAYTLYYRSYVWAGLFSKTKKFEKVNASMKEALISVFDVLLVIALILSVFHISFFYAFVFFFMIQSILNYNFYIFLLKEKGFFFMLRSILPNMLWSIVQILGATSFYINSILKKLF